MKLVRSRAKKVGMPPGTLVHIGDQTSKRVRITVFEYDATSFQERQLSGPDDIRVAASQKITWVDVGGVHDLAVIEAIGQRFQLHPLLLEDIVNTDQRPKLDDYETYYYVVLKMCYAGQRREDIHVEQVSLILGTTFVLSFQENGGDVFDPVRERLRTGKGRIRQSGADYLLYRLMDGIVDHYFEVMETLGEKVETVQDELLDNPQPELLRSIHALKRELIFLRRAVWPCREVMSSLERSESSLVQGATKLYIRDVYDHVVQILDTIEALREMVTGMLDIYLSSISYRLNAVMKVLTVITTIFMPLTFIVGIYGMNFQYMPELESRWGYPAVLLVMVSIAAGMLMFFKRKKWL